MDKDFYELSNQMHKENLYNEHLKRNSYQSIIEWEITVFNIWCHIHQKNYLSFNDFKEYLSSQKENEKMKAPLKKLIAENYFNIKLLFDYETNHWKEIKSN